MTAVLVDDERMSLEVLSMKLQKVAPALQILAAYQSPEEAILAIPQSKPDVLFLDIEMPVMDGFSMLNHFDKKTSPEIIFTTAYSNYAIEAIRQSAVDFLLKPIREVELLGAVQRLESKLQEKKLVSSPSVAMLQLDAQYNKIAVPTLRGVIFLPIQDILWLESDSNYTIFHVKNQEKIVACRTLKEFAVVLSSLQFVRIHRSTMINLAYLTEYIRGDGGSVILQGGVELEVSRGEKKSFLEKIGI